MAFQEFSARQYLKIDIANNFGDGGKLDKKLWEERIDWFDTHEHCLEQMVRQADEPALYFAGVQAWREVQKGNPIGYPITLDGCSSGLQILACLTGDRLAAELCNVVDTGYREDAYSAIYMAMLALIEEEGKVTRKKAKDAVMTSLYGSEAIPKEVFGEGSLLTTFYDTMRTLAPAAWELNETFLSIWDSSKTEYRWVMPDNFHVILPVTRNVKETVHFLNEPFEVTYKTVGPKDNGRSLGANTCHSIDGYIVREMLRRCNYDPARIAELKDVFFGSGSFLVEGSDKDTEMCAKLWEQYQKSGILSARILDHLNLAAMQFVKREPIEEMLNSLPKKPFELITIHDAFRCLPTYGNDLRRQYNLQLHLLARSNMLSHVLSQMIGQEIQVDKLDETLANDVLDANYALS